ncbi:peptide chain release factor N(5)-glutamine methyltransferase [Ancylobacter sp. IITR112]|uniref:peptide chain release factor N(5)-glutamine methyltransferase n=1 Tax=Ancylobacter sp. IITR112 TaxID=3138073 RepID=UPI00352B4927
MTTRAALLRAFVADFAAAGMEAPEREARALLRTGLGLADLDLIARADQPVGPDDEARLRALAARRAAGEPLARLTGRREFWSLDLALAPDTLVPRPETETLVEAALALFPDRTAPLRLLDLGTGSGALLAALLSEFPAALGVGVDLSLGAARQARENLGTLGLSARSAVLVGHWGEALRGGFDLVVSNPPYIPSTDIPALEREVRAHDPLLALDGGPQGLDAYRALAKALPSLLVAGGYAVLELGIGQEQQVAGLLAADGLAIQGPARPDLAGIARAIVARKG